ncbi:sensor histidine kinase [Halioglobus maricola]|uniref:Sensor histidine kinase n=1 Tax=Halioglobus maricola TaxID=2601894 RepID=A0A5P9NNF9_9GAMM|nr:histidine kinase [Halioglobus maricola]QFU76995.1 sensor histidine kinase [Halioglobus maricola]
MSAGLPANGSNNGTAHSKGSELFIPNLCSPQPVLFMVLLTELVVLVHVLAGSGLRAFDWTLFAGISLLAQWVVLLTAALLCWLRVPLSRFALPIVSALCLLLISVITAASSALAQALLGPLLDIPPDWSWVGRNILIANVLGGIALRYFYLQQQLQIQQRAELQARLDSLRARIRPHFLFNTLNSIASLIETRPERAERAVEDLAELFRATLKESSASTTVADEIRLLELYLDIEQLRLGERLAINWAIQPGCEELPMPSLLLQPLVENAVYHGVACIPEGGTIEIQVSAEEEHLYARIENPLPAEATPSEGNQIGLANVGLRLQAMYGEDASIAADQAAGRFIVELNYPARKISD